MFAGLLWKPWSRGIIVVSRSKVHSRGGYMASLMLGGLFSHSQSSMTLTDDLASPSMNMMLKWSSQLWAASLNLFSKMCSLACLSLVQDLFNFNFELTAFFQKYWGYCKGYGSYLTTTTLPSSSKSFFFVKQQPKSFLLWYWGSILAQAGTSPSVMLSPHRVTYVLCPVGFFLKKKKLMRTKKKI